MSTLIGNELSDRYHKHSDGELLQLAEQREQLTAAASAALDAELRARALAPEAIRQFEAETRKNAEAQAQNEVAELPPPSELPEDWFDEQAEEETVSVSAWRPKGVTVCAFLFWSGGVATAGFGAWAFFAKMASQWLMIGALGVIFGVLQCAIGAGLWRMRSRARQVAEAFCWLCVVLESLSIIGSAYIRLRGFSVSIPISILIFSSLCWQLLWALYLDRDSVRQAFLAAEKMGAKTSLDK